MPDHLDKTIPCLCADDTAIFLATKDVTQLSENLNHDLDKLSEWVIRNKLQHHPTKTKRMYIGSKHDLKNFSCDPTIMMKPPGSSHVRSLSYLTRSELG